MAATTRVFLVSDSTFCSHKVLPRISLGTSQIVKNVLFLFHRAHQNDLENIPFFILMATVYMVVAKPAIFTAKLVFYGFTAAR